MTNHHWRPAMPVRAHTSPLAASHAAGHHHHHAPVVSIRRPRPRHRKSLRSDDNNLPPFLRQTHTDIKRKFYLLENLQGERLTESLDPSSENSRWRLDESDEARMRNRYSNIAAWETNRIRLNVPAEHSDYINASPIVLTSKRDGSVKRYIATQGPKRGQHNHLWRMVWQETEEVAVIVMLTKMHELGQDKCFQYFPSQVGEEPWEIRDDGEFGDGFKAKITLLESTKDRKSACEVRKFELKVGGKSKIVWHLFFKGWPDYNVPEGTDKVALLELIRLANEKNSGPHNPLIVHCSAGVGRSGTFITLDHFLHEFEAGVIDQGDSEDPVFDVVNNLREQRMYMVQSQVQFQFIYQVLREQFQQRDKSASPRSSGILAEEDDSEDNYTGYY